MMYQRIFLILLFAFLGNSNAIASEVDNTDIGLDVAQVIKLPIDEDNSFVFVLEERLHQDWNNFDGVLPVFYFDHKLNERWSIGAGYRTEIFKPIDNTQEFNVNHVIYPQLNYRFNIKNLKVSTAVALEQNLLNHQEEDNKWFTNMLLRPRIRFELPLGEKKKFYLFNSHDFRFYIFNNTQVDSLFTMYRGEFGMGYKFNKSLKIEAGYRPRFNVRPHSRDELEHRFLTRIYITLPSLN